MQRPGATSNEDQALVARIAGGDRIALELLYRRHAGWLTARLQSRCGDPDLTDIAVQDTFVAVWRSAKRYRGTGEVGAWLWGIAIRRLIDQLRRSRATPIDPATIDTTIDTSIDVMAIDAHRRSAATFDEEVLGDGTHGELGPALAELAPELRAVLVATAIDGLTTREAARLLGVPQGTVKTRLMRARRALQEALA